jgi:hypothetical protein
MRDFKKKNVEIISKLEKNSKKGSFFPQWRWYTNIMPSAMTLINYALKRLLD